jgi:hypothetical protein
VTVTDPTDRTIRAPWTSEQVAALNRFQQYGGMHPFTCGGEHPFSNPTLVAQTDGWHCPARHCDYRQDWAHAFMVDRGRAATPAGPAPDTDRETQRERIVDALLTTSRADYPYRSGHEKWDHHKHGDRPGHSYAISCALCTGDVDALADAVLAVVPAPDNRAAVLLWAADQIDAGWFTTAATATAELRRLAGEVQQDEERGICTCAAAGVTLLPPGHYGDCPECPREVQQDPTQDGEEAHPPQHAWRVETRDPLANEWAPGSHFPRRQAAVERYETANRTAPLWRDGTPVERRIVRETTTYTVEEPTAVARPGQPETETSP